MESTPSFSPSVSLAQYEPVSQEVLASLPPDFVRQRMIVPVKIEGKSLVVAVPRTAGIIRPEGVSLIVNMPVKYVLTSIDEIISFIKTHYPDEKNTKVTSTSSNKFFENDLSETVRSMSGPLQDTIQKLLLDAILNRAHEIRITQTPETIRIRERIRGNLINADNHLKLAREELEAAFSWIKQEGIREERLVIQWTSLRKEVLIKNETVVTDFFLSEVPNIKNLTVTLNIKKETVFSPSSWGMDPAQTHLFEEFLEKKQGVLLFCGTDDRVLEDYLMATATMLATPNRHVIAVGDYPRAWPVGVDEYPSQGNDQKFRDLLHLAFRHGPDLLVADPIKTKEDFDICLSESLPGRYVMGRIFGIDAADALLRLLQMNVDPSLLGSALLGIVARRSLRLNCAQCQIEDPAGRSMAKELGIPLAMQPPRFFKGKGCENCGGTGSAGETDVFEILPMTDDIRSHLKSDAKAEVFRADIRSKGLLTLRGVAIHKAVNGQTSLSEVIRSTPK